MGGGQGVVTMTSHFYNVTVTQAFFVRFAGNSFHPKRLKLISPKAKLISPMAKLISPMAKLMF